MRCIALIDHGPNWIPDRSVYEQGAPIEAHLASMRRRYDEGVLLLGGPFASHRGGIAVLDVDDEAAARRLMDADPAVVAGVMSYRLETVIAYFDVMSQTRTTATASQLDPRRDPS
jgi:uncharacterized protein YciI